MYDVEPVDRRPRGFFNTLMYLYHSCVGTLPEVEIDASDIAADPEPVLEHKQIAEKVLDGVMTGLYTKAIIGESIYAKVKNIPTYEQALATNSVGTIPTHLDAPFECIDNKEVGRTSHTVWVLYFEDGHNEIVVPTPTVGKLLLGCDIIHVNDPASPMPDGVVRALKVVLGTELVGNSLRGCRWAHYSL